MNAVRADRRALPAAVLLLLPVLAGCATTAGPPPDGANDVVGAAVCEAAEAETVQAAERAFAGSHTGLHLLAQELQDRDERAAAGRLLEAKQLVEADLAEEPPDPSLFRNLAELADATTTAASLIDPDTPRCDERTSS